MIKLSHIQTITENCIRLLTVTEKLKRNQKAADAYKYVDSLFPLLRKLTIASNLYNRCLICISGLQGAGKTTLMKNFYGIGDDYLNVSIGRGERVPVLITEGNVTEPHIVSVNIEKDEEGNYVQKEIVLRKEDIIQATKGEDPSTMYLELTVPYKHTFNKGVSFMLLPGFEKKNEYWNSLIEFSVNSSDAAVFVFNESSFSNASNEDYLKKIESKFGDNVVYAISGSDGSSDDNEQVKKTCMEVLKIREADRVVCVGQYNDQERNNIWIEAFKNAIEKYALYETQVTQRANEYITNELIEIKDILYTILGILNENDDSELKSYNNHRLLQSYDAAIMQKRNELVKNIDNQLDNAKKESATEFAKQLDATPWYKNLKRTFFGTSVKDQYLEIPKMIESSLYKDSYCLPDLYMGRAISNSIRSLDKPKSDQSNTLQVLLDKEEKEGKQILLNTEDNKKVFSDVCELISIPQKNIRRYTLQCENSSQIMQVIAEIATYYYGLMEYGKLSEVGTSGLPYYEPAESTITGDDVIEGAKSSKKFAIGLAGVMGVDILADGSLNLISQIATSCSIALPYAALGAVLIVGAGAASVVIKDINRMQRADFESGKMAINGIYDNIKKAQLDRFDDFARRVRSRIESNLEDLGGENKSIITILNAKMEVNNLLDFLDLITNDYLQKSHDITANFTR